MSLARKSLQDTFDAAINQAKELENSQRDSLSVQLNSHLETMPKQVPNWLQLLENCTQQLIVEIEDCLNPSLKKLENAITYEAQENHNCVKNLVQALGLLADKFQQQIEQLRQSSERKLVDMSLQATELAKLQAEGIRDELHKDGLSTFMHFTTEATAATNSLLQNAEDNIQKVSEAQYEAKNQLYATSVAQLSLVRTAFFNALESLPKELEKKITSLELKSNQVETDMTISLKELTDEVNHHIAVTKANLSERLDQTLTELGCSFDSLTLSLSSELNTLHESSNTTLLNKAQELNSHMYSLSQSLGQTINTKAQETQERVNYLMESLTNDLAQKIESYQVLQNELENERASLIKDIWTQLSHIEVSFKDKLVSIASSTIHQLKSSCLEAETMIAEVARACHREFQAAARIHQSFIEVSTKELCDRVIAHRNEALKAVAIAKPGHNVGQISPFADSSAVENSTAPNECLITNVAIRETPLESSRKEPDKVAAKVDQKTSEKKREKKKRSPKVKNKANNPRVHKQPDDEQNK